MTKQISKAETAEQSRLRVLIEGAKRLNIYPNIKWDDFAWNITDCEKPLAHAKRRLVLYFTAPRPKKGSPHSPYEGKYADFAKTIIRMRASERGLSFAGQAHMIIAVRHLYATLKCTGTTDPTKLTRRHFNTTLVDIQSHAKEWTIYHVGISLQEISAWIDRNRITQKRVNFKNPIVCPPRGDELDPESQAKGLLKMPSTAALSTLADISNNPINDNERILLRTIDLLFVGGFRIGEALRLPLDCWVETPALDHNGKIRVDPSTGMELMRYGIRYWPEKSGDAIVKWLPEIAVTLARRAVIDLTNLCAEARACATIVEQTPGRVPFTCQYQENDLIDLKQVAGIFGLKSVQSARRFLVESLELLPTAKRKPNRSGAFLYRVGDIEKALLKRLRTLEIIRKPNGQVQMLSESLCVMFQNQFFKGKPVFRCLPELIDVGPINQALGNDADEESVFSRRGLTEADGSKMRIKTHAFRHWINTLMAQGGLSDLELARWSGRHDIRQNAAYKHGTVEQRVTWAQEMIKAKELKGAVADMYHAIDDPAEKQEYLETFVDVAHFTPYGVCVHNYAVDPCPYHLSCLCGCPEYLRTKGDQEERKNINDILNFHLVQLQHSKSADENKQKGINNFREHNQRIIDGARAALAIDDTEASDELVKVFPKGKLLGKAIDKALGN